MSVEKPIHLDMSVETATHVWNAIIDYRKTVDSAASLFALEEVANAILRQENAVNDAPARPAPAADPPAYARTAGFRKQLVRFPDPEC